jgi:hypothetical protein
VRERLAKRQQEAEALGRVIALKTRTLETPIADVGDDRIASFADALQKRLRDQEGAAFRRAYLRLMLDKVVVGQGAIKISGPKAALAHQIAADNPLPPALAPTFVQDWRASEGDDAYWMVSVKL